MLTILLLAIVILLFFGFIVGPIITGLAYLVFFAVWIVISILRGVVSLLVPPRRPRPPT